ncbi:MAG: PIN domain-containing protein [Sphingobacteriales bacterium]|nr:PIN domain-containing protein [Sphingobacteriales bacterium]MBI3718442.1 PIN domain-containing protein [Sphingobacteriales bacterium]
MKIFLDANILISIVNKEYPLFTTTSRILSLVNHRQFEVFTSPLCLAITFYFAEKKNKTTARNKIKILTENISITNLPGNAVKKVFQNNRINDFEDGLEYYSALEAKCKCIITEDVDDFYFSDIEVLTADGFFKKYMAGKS